MSRSLPALQEHAHASAEAFCQRYIKSLKYKRYRKGNQKKEGAPETNSVAGKFYRPRDHTASPFYKIVRQYFEEFERVYPERYQERYGYWRPVINDSISKFLKCGDLQEGFARVRCPDCKKEFFVGYSCRQRSCCPSCDKKRSLLLAYRLNSEVLADVPHRQWVLTLPKRLRVYFRFDRSLLGKLCRTAYDVLSEVFEMEIDGDCGVPAMIGTVQTHGNLIHWNVHIHAILAEGLFTESGHFVSIPDIDTNRVEMLWRDRVFSLLLNENKINEEIIANMRSWKFSGFSVDNSVRIERGDTAGMQRLIEYIARCPFSLNRMVSITRDGKIIYRASKATCFPFPLSGDETLMAGVPRNFEIFEPLDFLAGLRKKEDAKQVSDNSGQNTQHKRKCTLSWAALIRAVFEVDPLKCQHCGGTMKIVSFIKEKDVIRSILKHCKLWKENLPRPPPVNSTPSVNETQYDYSFVEPA